MASYRIVVVRKDEFVEADNKRYAEQGRNWKACEVYHISFNIDMLIKIIEKCEDSGIYVRRTLAALCPSWKTSKVDKKVPLIIGRIVSTNNCWEVEGTTQQLHEGVINDMLLRDFGNAIIKCYRIAEKYDIIKAAQRCDDRFRYWVHFTMCNDPWNFEHLILKKWFGNKQYEYAYRYIHLSNALTLLEKWDEYTSSLKNTEEFTDLNNYTQRFVMRVNVEVLIRAINYLRILSHLVGRNFYTNIAVDGVVKRTRISFPSELLTPYLADLKVVIEKLNVAQKSMQPLTDASDTLDCTTFNIYVWDDVARDIRILYDIYDALISYTVDLNLDTRKTIGTKYWRRFSEIKPEIRKVKEPSADKKIAWTYGYNYYGCRYSRLPRVGDNRVAVFK